MDENSKNLNEENIYECKLRGTLKVKNDKMNCIIGDCVEFDEKEKVIEKIEKINFSSKNILKNLFTYSLYKTTVYLLHIVIRLIKTMPYILTNILKKNSR